MTKVRKAKIYIIRCKQLKYTHEQFYKQINELLELGLIRQIINPHSSPEIFVQNNGEQARGKAESVIDYRELNKKIIFHRYYIHVKEVLINKTRDAQYFSKFDC